MKLETRVCIIGGGATGVGLARDLALRGVECLLVEKRDIAVGASGGNHGLLHSGGRYVQSDPHSATECMLENDILKQTAPHLIDDTGGLFVAVQGDDDQFVADYPDLCAKAGVPCSSVDPADAREMEPALADSLVAAYAVQDSAIDPFMLCLDNIFHAVSLGAALMRNARVTSFHMERNRIAGVELLDETTGETHTVHAELVVNASGAWAGIVAGMAGVELNVLYSMGTLVITQDRITHRIINRLRPPSDADILVPGGTVSILGTTSERIDHPDQARPSIAEVDRMIEDGADMVPVLADTRYIRAYAGVRPLVSLGKAADGSDRNVSRGFALLDHAEENVENFVTITGGKLTTFRLMAEKTADLVCAKLGVDARCTTRTAPLPSTHGGMWTEPGVSARAWIEKYAPHDVILCECEMVSAGVVDAIVKDMAAMGHTPDQLRGRSLLKAVGQRSRVGKGPCQGGYCGPRVTAHLYDTGALSGDQGLHELTRFIERRWRGKKPVLWGHPLMQAELQEAMQCAIMDLELLEDVQDIQERETLPGPEWT